MFTIPNQADIIGGNIVALPYQALERHGCTKFATKKAQTTAEAAPDDTRDCTDNEFSPMKSNPQNFETLIPEVATIFAPSRPIGCVIPGY